MVQNAAATVGRGTCSGLRGFGEHKLHALPPIPAGAPGAAALSSPGHGSHGEERVSVHTEQPQGKNLLLLGDSRLKLAKSIISVN